MTEEQFKSLALYAKRLGGDYATGYLRGLRRHYHGEKFGTSEEHEIFMSLDGSRAEIGRGYRDAFAGNLPAPQGQPIAPLPPKVGRPPLPEEEKTMPYSVRLNKVRTEKLKRLREKHPGWLERKIDEESDE